MSNINQEELDTWVAEVELAHKYITDLKDGKISVEELDRKDKAKALEKEREEEKKREKERQLMELKKQGRSGKGEKENYYHFCRFCFWEYELPTPDCLRCGKSTLTYAERRADLIKKAEEYKKNKVRREERKKKWELWKKTKAMLWKKTSTNYSKWEYFTSSSESEQEDSEPIVPTHDPNFQALERDLEERAQRRKESRQKAET